MTFEHYEREELASAAAGEAAQRANESRAAQARRQFRRAVALAYGQYQQTLAQCGESWYEVPVVGEWARGLLDALDTDTPTTVCTYAADKYGV